MTKICFHLNNLSFRGTTTAIIDYAKYNEKLLNNISIIAYNKKIKDVVSDENYTKIPEIVEFFKSNFDVIEYTSKENLKLELDKRNCQYIYYLKGGWVDDDYLDGKRNLIHVVFNAFQPHGEKYVYISNWLQRTSDPTNTYPYVPHIVDLPVTVTEDLRLKFNISENKFVIGRHGGFDQFDIPFVNECIHHIVNNNDDIIFLFMNTRKFVDHPNVIFIDPVFDKQDKTNFILACNTSIHARSDGESFGLSICESLFHNIPVLSFGGGRDKNNVELLEPFGLIYNNGYEFIDKILELKMAVKSINYRKIIEQFLPEQVMVKFNDVFLSR